MHKYSLSKKYLIDKLDNNFLYDEKIHQWYQYNVDNSNVWSIISNLKFEKIIENFIEEHPNFNEQLNNSYLDNVIKKLKRNLIIDFNKFLNENNHLVPFNNGILNLKTLELLDHSKNYNFTYKLNIDYDPKAKMKKIFVDWL